MGEEKPARNISTSSGTSIGTSMSIKNQQRLSLETTWKSLELERQHFLKLMALNEKLLRSRQEKREGRMTHIHSHLTVPQIAEIEKRWRGREDPMKRVGTVSSSLRVKDNGGGVGGSGSLDEVDGRMSHQQDGSKQLALSNSGYSRSNSFYGHERSPNRRKGTAENGQEPVRVSEQEKLFIKRERNSQSAPKTRGKSIEWKDDLVEYKTHPPGKARLKPSGKGLSGSSPNLDKLGTSSSMPTIPSRLRSSSSSSSPSTFSCHEEYKRDAGRRRSQSVEDSVHSRAPTITSTSSPPTNSSSSSSVFHDAIDAINKERTRSDMRNLMVIENDLQYMQLRHRKEALMADIADMVKRDRDFAQKRRRFIPPPAPAKISLTSLSHAELMESSYHGVDINDLRKEIRRRKNERMRERMKMDVPADQLKRKENETEDEYAKRIEKWWRDMRKARYLRRESTRQDLSDVVTLAMAQQKNDKIWRQSLRDNLF